MMKRLIIVVLLVISLPAY
ncbi:type I toxin-antitoxin system Ibs family toxin [Escherichia coli]